MQDQPQNPASSVPGSPPSPPPGHPVLPAPSAPRAKRKWHRFFTIVIILVVAFIVFVAILPTLLSMGWARRVVENKANARLPGQLHISDWSLGWFSGTKIGPIAVSDASGNPLVQLASLDTHLSLLDVIRGKYDLGKVPITGLRLYITREPDGKLNLQKLLPAAPKPSRAPPPAHPATPLPAAAPSAPSTLPDISVDLELSDCHAVLTDAKTGLTVICPMSGSVKIPNINQPITNDLKIAIKTSPFRRTSPPMDLTGVTVSLAGTIAAVHDNHLDLNQPDVDENLKITGISLANLGFIFNSDFTALEGEGDGEFSLRLTPRAPGLVKGGLRINGIRAVGPATLGDAFVADSFAVIVPPTLLPTANGLAGLAATTDRFTVGAGVQPIAMVLQQGKSVSSVSFNADAAMASLLHLARNQSPDDDGKVEFAADIDLAHWADQLPHRFHLKPGISLDSAQLKATAGITMTATDATASASLLLDHITGKKAGKSITLKPTQCSGSVVDIGGGGAIPKLQNIQAELSSAFATGTISASTPSQISGQFNAKLADMKKELGQVIDFGSTDIRGAIAANISSQADQTDGDSAARSRQIHGTLTASDLHLGKGAATYACTYTLNQAISTVAGIISTKGSVQGGFSVQNQNAAAFSEPNFSLLDELSYSRPNDSLTLTNILLDMRGTGAGRVAVRGTIADLTTARTMQDVSADLHYDAAGLWKLIYATLTPEQQKSCKDVKVTGTIDRHFVIAGSYPANQPFNVAVQSLTVQGGVALATFEGKGMSIANFDVPLSLHRGLFFIAEPTPATMNGGALSLNGITIDLSDPHERLSIPDNTPLFKDVSLNPIFVQYASGWIYNPLFDGADKAAGILNLTIDHCRRLPLDDLLGATTADNDGTIQMHMTLGRVQIGAPMLTDITRSLGPLLSKSRGAPSLQGEIPNYTVDIARGVMTSDMTMNLSQHQHPLHLAGTVALAGKKLNMMLDLPTALFGGDRGPLAHALGAHLQIPITGTANHPQFNVKSILQKNLKIPGKDLNDLLKGLGE